MNYTKDQKVLINQLLPKIVTPDMKSIIFEFYDNNTKFSYQAEYQKGYDQESLFDEMEQEDDITEY